jgi:hypothetical protein
MKLGWTAAAETHRSLFKFDLTPLLGHTIASASLGMLVSAAAAADSPIKIARVTRNWLEDQVTWNVWRTGNNWSTKGGDYVSPALVGTLPIATGLWNINGSALLDLCIDAVTNRVGYLYIILFRETEGVSDSVVTFRSSDSGFGVQRPVLTLEYDVRNSGAIVAAMAAAIRGRRR